MGTPSVLTEDGVFNTATYIFGRQKIPVWRNVPSYCYLSEFLCVIFKLTFNMASVWLIWLHSNSEQLYKLSKLQQTGLQASLLFILLVVPGKAFHLAHIYNIVLFLSLYLGKCLCRS